MFCLLHLCLPWRVYKARAGHFKGRSMSFSGGIFGLMHTGDLLYSSSSILSRSM